MFRSSRQSWNLEWELEERVSQANELRARQLGQLVANLTAEVRADRNEYRRRLERLEGGDYGE